MTTDNLSAREALDEVARRRDQTVTEAHRDWSWRYVLMTCAGLLLMGIGFDYDQLWLVVVVLVVLTVIGRNTVKLRSGKGPGLGFMAGLLGFMLVSLILFQGVWRGFELPFPALAGNLGACLILLAATPVAQRLIARRAARTSR